MMWVLRLAFIFLFAYPAFAEVTLKQVQVRDGSSIDLLFDGPVQNAQIKTDYFGEIVQLSLQGVNVYPAKILSVNGGEVTKVFAYQYAPKLVRARFTVKGKAEDYKSKLALNIKGKLVSIRVGKGGGVFSQKPVQNPVVAATEDKIETTSAQALRLATQNAVNENPALTAKVMGTAPDKTADKATDKTAEKVADKKADATSGEAKDKEDVPLKAQSRTAYTSGNKNSALPSIPRMLGWLIFLGGIAAMLFVLVTRKNWFGKMLNGSFGKKGKMIEVLSTQYLGPKKCIAVIKVSGRVMVVGVTNESINLISELPEETAEETAEEVAFGSIFEGEKTRPQTAPSIGMTLNTSPVGPQAARAQAPAPVKVSARDRIRSRLEGLKQL